MNLIFNLSYRQNKNGYKIFTNFLPTKIYRGYEMEYFYEE